MGAEGVSGFGTISMTLCAGADAAGLAPAGSFAVVRRDRASGHSSVAASRISSAVCKTALGSFFLFMPPPLA
jgi:hypothetical protein